MVRGRDVKLRPMFSIDHYGSVLVTGGVSGYGKVL